MILESERLLGRDGTVLDSVCNIRAGDFASLGEQRFEGFYRGLLFAFGASLSGKRDVRLTGSVDGQAFAVRRSNFLREVWTVELAGGKLLRKERSTWVKKALRGESPEAFFTRFFQRGDEKDRKVHEALDYLEERRRVVASFSKLSLAKKVCSDRPLTVRSMTEALLRELVEQSKQKGNPERKTLSDWLSYEGEKDRILKGLSLWRDGEKGHRKDCALLKKYQDQRAFFRDHDAKEVKAMDLRKQAKDIDRRIHPLNQEKRDLLRVEQMDEDFLSTLSGDEESRWERAEERRKRLEEERELLEAVKEGLAIVDDLAEEAEEALGKAIRAKEVWERSTGIDASKGEEKGKWKIAEKESEKARKKAEVSREKCVAMLSSYGISSFCEVRPSIVRIAKDHERKARVLEEEVGDLRSTLAKKRLASKGLILCQKRLPFLQAALAKLIDEEKHLLSEAEALEEEYRLEGVGREFLSSQDLELSVQSRSAKIQGYVEKGRGLRTSLAEAEAKISSILDGFPEGRILNRIDDLIKESPLSGREIKAIEALIERGLLPPGEDAGARKVLAEVWFPSLLPSEGGDRKSGR